MACRIVKRECEVSVGVVLGRRRSDSIVMQLMNERDLGGKVNKAVRFVIAMAHREQLPWNDDSGQRLCEMVPASLTSMIVW